MTAAATAGDFSASATGLISYRTSGSSDTELTWFDRAGKRIGTAVTAPAIGNPRFSPDESKVAFNASAPTEIWVHDLQRGVNSKLAFGGEDYFGPVWSPDGRRIAYGSYSGIYAKDAIGAGAEDMLLKHPNLAIPRDWSRDSRFILFFAGVPNRDLWTLTLAADRKVQALLTSPADENAGALSPGTAPKYVAYESTESGVSQIYVQTYPPGGGKWQVSRDGGASARWRGDAKELFYLTPDGAMMAVDVETGESFRAGTPRRLFAAFPVTRVGTPYDVTGDGQKFIVVTAPHESAGSDYIHVIVNWEGLLKR